MRKSESRGAKKTSKVLVQDSDKNETKDLIAEIDEMLSSKPICSKNVTARDVGVNSKAVKILSNVKVKLNRIPSISTPTNQKKKDEISTPTKLQKPTNQNSICKTIKIPTLVKTLEPLPKKVKTENDKKLIVPSLTNEIAKKLANPNFVSQEIKVEVDDKELLKDILLDLESSNILSSAKIKVEKDDHSIVNVARNLDMNTLGNQNPST